MGKDSEEVKWWYDVNWVDERVDSNFGDGYSYKYKCPSCEERPFAESTPDKWEVYVRCVDCDISTFINDRRLNREDL